MTHCSPQLWHLSKNIPDDIYFTYEHVTCCDSCMNDYLLNKDGITDNYKGYIGYHVQSWDSFREGDGIYLGFCAFDDNQKHIAQRIIDFCNSTDKRIQQDELKFNAEWSGDINEKIKLNIHPLEYHMAYGDCPTFTLTDDEELEDDDEDYSETEPPFQLYSGKNDNGDDIYILQNGEKYIELNEDAVDLIMDPEHPCVIPTSDGSLYLLMDQTATQVFDEDEEYDPDLNDEEFGILSSVTIHGDTAHIVMNQGRMILLDE